MFEVFIKVIGESNQLISYAIHVTCNLFPYYLDLCIKICSQLMYINEKYRSS
jgi:hypothetical protein